MDVPVELGPFRRGPRLGAGGQAEVFAACHLATGLSVAVKVHPPGADVLVDRELHAIAGLDHPHIVRLWGAGITADRRWLAMELATGTLADAPPTDWASLREVAHDVLSALAHAHAREVLHLDLKPENLLVGCPDGADELAGRVPGLRLSDFGMSRAQGDHGRIRGGTVGWMAPEQRRGEPDRLGPPTDLFGLGATLWALATGCGPDDRAMPGSFRPRFLVPAELEEWLGWLLDPEPSGRPQRAAEALRGLPGGEGTPEAKTRLRVPATPALDERTLNDVGTLADFATLGDFATLDGVLEPRISVEPEWTEWRQPETWGRIRWLTDAGLGPTAARWPRFVGRDAERDQLWSTFREVRERGRQAVVVVEGPSGVGTSRLAAWLGGRLHELDLAVTVGVVHTATGGPDEGLAAAVRRLTGTAQRRGWPLHHRLLEFVRGLPGSSPVLVEGLQELVSGQSDGRSLLTLGFAWAERPLVILVDDASHGADSVALARFALDAREAHPASVLFVLVTRDAAPLVAALGHQVPRISLGPLSLGELDVLTRDWMGLAAETADHVLARSEGLPGQIVARVVGLERAAVLAPSPRGFTLVANRDATAPEAPLDDLVAAADGMAPDLARVQAVDTLGQAVAGLPPEHPTRGAHGLASLHLECVRGRTVEARHRAESLVEDADRHGWTYVGARTAELLGWLHQVQTDYAGAAEWTVEAAARYSRLGDDAAMARVQVRQCQLLMRSRPDQVVPLATRLTTGPPTSTVVSGWVLLAQALVALGEPQAAVSPARRSLETMRMLDRTDLEGRVRRDLGRILSLAGHRDEAEEHTRFALHAARAEGNRTSTVFALGVWAHLLRRAGDLDGTMAALLEAAELAERSSAFLGAVDADIAATLLLRGEVDQAESRLGRVRPLDAPERSFRFVLVAWIALHRERLDDARTAWASAGAGELAHVRQHAEIAEWEVHVAATGRETGLIQDLSDLD